MFITTVVSRILQSLEFFRSGFGRYFSTLFTNSIVCHFFTLPFLIFSIIRFIISLFTSLCSKIAEMFHQINFSGFQVGGVDILSLANTVLPVDELIGLIVAWFGVYAVCASIRFVRAAWSAIPFKAS